MFCALTLELYKMLLYDKETSNELIAVAPPLSIEITGATV